MKLAAGRTAGEGDSDASGTDGERRRSEMARLMKMNCHKRQLRTECRIPLLFRKHLISYAF